MPEYERVQVLHGDDLAERVVLKYLYGQINLGFNMKLHLDVGCAEGIWMLDEAMKYRDLVFVGLDEDVTPNLITNSPQGVYNLIKSGVIRSAHARAYKEEHGLPGDDFLSTGDSENLHKMLSDPYRKRILFVESDMNKLRFGQSLHSGTTYSRASYQEVLQETLHVMSEHPRGQRMLKYRIGEVYRPNAPNHPFRIDFPGLPEMTVEDFLKSQPSAEFVNHYKPYTDRISVVVGDARHLPFADGIFDSVTVLNLGHDRERSPEAEKQFDTLVDETSRVVKVGCQVTIIPVPHYMEEEYPDGMTVERTS
ncbi:MAG: class I SAM-dependent methyltransferase [Candidatus Aenigmarchaeota archaeon]|nr:class I SAM-dependent methyltransferase [Candidatus Aenigmarchaeota archaeon]